MFYPPFGVQAYSKNHEEIPSEWNLEVLYVIVINLWGVPCVKDKVPKTLSQFQLLSLSLIHFLVFLIFSLLFCSCLDIVGFWTLET